MSIPIDTVLILMPMVAIALILSTVGYAGFSPLGSWRYALAMIGSVAFTYLPAAYMPLDPNDMSYDSMGSPVGILTLVSGLVMMSAYLSTLMRSYVGGWMFALLGFIAYPSMTVLMHDTTFQGYVGCLLLISVFIELAILIRRHQQDEKLPANGNPA
jgi:hypothetical protein